MIDLALKKWLTDQSIANSVDYTIVGSTYTPNPWVAWCNWIPAEPSEAISIQLSTGGGETLSSLQGAMESKILLRFRGAPDKEVDLRSKTFAGYNALKTLRDSSSRTITLTSGEKIYCSLVAFNSPGYAGLDDNRRGHWAIQVRVIWNFI
jgi:hypothetical protein